MAEEYKKISVEFKEGEDHKGQVKAVFSLFNDVDSDGDVVLPTAIKSGFDEVNETVPMVWAHQWDKPIGKGYIKKDSEKAVFDGEFFMDTESGAEAYKLVKNMGELQQWSFGFRVNDSEYGKFKKDGKEETEVRYLKDLSVYEVSPVLVGANQDTFTMAIKSQKSDTVQKSVLGHDSIQKEEDSKEAEEVLVVDDKKAVGSGDIFPTAEEAERRAKEIGCSGSHIIDDNGQAFYMPCATHEDYEKTMQKNNVVMNLLSDIAQDMKEVLKQIPTDEKSVDTLKEITEKFKSVKDQVFDDRASVQGKRFSDEVKDVLAALNNLVARVQTIGELRAKNGRKLGVSATEALRTVQESVQDAFDEIDKFVAEFGTEDELEETQEVENEAQTEEILQAETEVIEEATDEVSEEVVEAQAETTDPDPEPEVDTNTEREVEDPVDEAELPTEEVLDNELDALWLESQKIETETILTDIEIEDTLEDIEENV